MSWIDDRHDKLFWITILWALFIAVYQLAYRYGLVVKTGTESTLFGVMIVVTFVYICTEQIMQTIEEETNGGS